MIDAGLRATFLTAVLATGTIAAESWRAVETPIPFRTDKGEVAGELSGIACLPASASPRVCMVVNDDGVSVQLATLADGKLVAGDRIALIGSGARPGLGRPPERVRCPGGRDDKIDLDGEAVAFLAPFFYVAGSHGCSRGKGFYRANAFLLARIRVDREGVVVSPEGRPLSGRPGPDEVETTFRLSDALRRLPELEPFFSEGLDPAANGLNVEGLAAVGSLLYAGLRAPALGEEAAIVSVDADALFAPGHAPYAGPVRMLRVPVGRTSGIRDLAALSDGRLLALVGPAQRQPLPYRILLVDPREPSAAREVAEVGTPPGPQAEGLLVVSEAPGSARVLVIFDDAPNGAPREADIALR